MDMLNINRKHIKGLPVSNGGSNSPVYLLAVSKPCSHDSRGVGEL